MNRPRNGLAGRRAWGRRRALGVLGAGAAGGMVWQFGRGDGVAAPKEGWPDFSFLVVSDTHLGRKDNESAARQWVKTAAALREAEGAFVLHLGDVVDQGREAQYGIYRETRETIGKPVHEIPGNHDPAELFGKHVRRETDTVVDHGGVRFVLFNNSRTDSHDGFVTAEQLRWIEARCAEAEAAGMLVIFCAHVPFHANRHPDRGWYVKPENGQGEFYGIVERYRERVLGLFHGHFHNGLRGWTAAERSPVEEICFPSALYNLDRGLAAKGAPGYNLTEFRPAYVAATLKAGTLRLAVRAIGGEAESAEARVVSF